MLNNRKTLVLIKNLKLRNLQALYKTCDLSQELIKKPGRKQEYIDILYRYHITQSNLSYGSFTRKHFASDMGYYNYCNAVITLQSLL